MAGRPLILEEKNTLEKLSKLPHKDKTTEQEISPFRTSVLAVNQRGAATAATPAQESKQLSASSHLLTEICEMLGTQVNKKEENGSEAFLHPTRRRSTEICSAYDLVKSTLLRRFLYMFNSILINILYILSPLTASSATSVDAAMPAPMATPIINAAAATQDNDNDTHRANNTSQVITAANPTPASRQPITTNNYYSWGISGSYHR
ncbi:hypothetical protein KCV07_g9850, partial [Aureobasidium melanogenum]